MTTHAERSMKRANDKRCVTCAVPLEPIEVTRGGAECEECAALAYASRPTAKPAPVPSRLAANLAARRSPNQNAGTFPRPILKLPASEATNGPLLGKNETPTSAIARLEASPAVQTHFREKAAPLVVKEPAPRYAKPGDAPERERLRAFVNAQHYTARLGLSGEQAATVGIDFARKWIMADSAGRHMLVLELD